MSGTSPEVVEEPTSEVANATAEAETVQNGEATTEATLEAETAQSGEANTEATLEAETTAEQNTVSGKSTKVAEEPAYDSRSADSKQATATEPTPEPAVASMTDSEQSTADADAEDVNAESSAEPLEVISAKEYHTQKQNEIHGVWRSDNPNSAYSSHLTEADNHGFNGGKTQGQGLGTMYNAPKSATFMFHEAQDRSEEIREAKRRHDSEQHAFAIDQHVFAGTNSYRQMGAVSLGADSKDTVKPEEQGAQPKEEADKSAYASSSKIQWLSHDSE